jgi:hypothetical protein
MSAPTFIAKSVKVTAPGTGGVVENASLNYMGSILAGDELYIFAMTDCPGAATGSVTGPAGWEAMGGTSFNDNNPAFAGVIQGFKKTADGTESGSVTVQGLSDVNFTVHAQMYQFRADKQILVEDTATVGNGDGAATIQYAALSLGGNARTLLAFCGSPAGLPGVPTGYVSAASDSALYLFTKENTGADGAVTSTGGDTGGWATLHASTFTPTGYSFIPDH